MPPHEPIPTDLGPESGRTRLSGRTGRALYNQHGWTSLVMGLISFGVGTGLSLIWTGVIRVDPGSVHAPLWVLGAIGGVFALVGLWLLFLGVRGRARSARAKHLRQSHPNEPWLADHPWDNSGSTDNSRLRMINSLAASGFLLLFLTPFNYITYTAIPTHGTPVLMLSIVGLFDAIAVAALAYAGYLFARYAKFGLSRLRFERFPYRLGQTFEAAFHPSRGIGRARKISFTLRCIQDRIVVTGRGKNRHTHVHCYELWADRFVIDGPVEHRATDPAVPVTFMLPNHPHLNSDLSAREPRYWELQVQADTPGVDFDARFLVPVYV